MLALAFAVALSSPPWQTIAQGGSFEIRPIRQPAFIAATRARATAFSRYLREEDRVAVSNVDFRKNVAVAAFAVVPTRCYRLEIVNLQRRMRVLTLTAVVRTPPDGTGCILPLTRIYHVIAVPRSVIGRPLPQRIELKMQPQGAAHGALRQALLALRP